MFLHVFVDPPIGVGGDEFLVTFLALNRPFFGVLNDVCRFDGVRGG